MPLRPEDLQKHAWAAGAEDAVNVHRRAKENAARFGADAGRVYLGGESAGAAHVAAALLIRRFHPPQGLTVARAVLISGVYNVHLERLARAQFGIATPDPWC